jgi:hypothetical protein
LTWFCWVAAGLLNKLASLKLWWPICLSELSHNIFWGLSGIHLVVFSSPCNWLSVLACQEGCTCQVSSKGWSEGREPLSQWTKEVSFSHTKEPEKAWESTWEPYSSDW